MCYNKENRTEGENKDMRLWHKELIPVLPRKQLLSQWRECCCIARNIAVNGTPNHILVNKVLDYPDQDFIEYCCMVRNEMLSRGYKCSNASTETLFDFVGNSSGFYNNDNVKPKLFEGWHNDRYFWQCYYNLQEKYDCGGVSEEEWHRIYTYARHVKFGEVIRIKI